MGLNIFVTATDTDAGKTFVTASLIRALRQKDLKACALKPVCCGRRGRKMNADVAVLLRSQGLPDSRAGTISLHDFAGIAAPSQAAAEEGRRIDPGALVHWCSARAMEHDITLIEGVGGLMVPLAAGFLVSDWLSAMPEAAVLLVVRSRLGGISHGLLALDKLRHMGREPRWVVINDADGAGNTMLQQHAQAIRPFLPSSTQLLTLSHMLHADWASPSSLTELAGDITKLAEE